MRIRYRAQALGDIDQIYRYLLKRSPSGALNVLRAIYAGISGNSHTPANGLTIHRCGSKAVWRYRYKIFYSIIDGETVEIMHVRHTSRRPWVGESEPGQQQ